MKDKIKLEGICCGEAAENCGKDNYVFEMSRSAFVVLTGLRDIVCSNPLELNSVTTTAEAMMCKFLGGPVYDNGEPVAYFPPNNLELVVMRKRFFWRFECGEDDQICKTEDVYFDDMERMWA